MGKRKKIYIGVDETNHGAYPELFALVSSPFREDKIKTCKNKIRKHSAVIQELYPYTQRDFRYSIIQKIHYDKYGHEGLIVNLVPRMISDLNLSDYFSAGIYIDGLLGETQKRSIEKILLANSSLKEVRVTDVPKNGKNKTIQIIAFADCIANFLQTKKFAELNKPPLSKKLVDFV